MPARAPRLNDYNVSYDLRTSRQRKSNNAGIRYSKREHRNRRIAQARRNELARSEQQRLSSGRPNSTAANLRSAEAQLRMQLAGRNLLRGTVAAARNGDPRSGGNVGGMRNVMNSDNANIRATIAEIRSLRARQAKNVARRKTNGGSGG